jgi:hypothetical protein
MGGFAAILILLYCVDNNDKGDWDESSDQLSVFVLSSVVLASSSIKYRR